MNIIFFISNCSVHQRVLHRASRHRHIGKDVLPKSIVLYIQCERLGWTPKHAQAASCSDNRRGTRVRRRRVAYFFYDFVNYIPTFDNIEISLALKKST